MSARTLLLLTLSVSVMTLSLMALPAGAEEPEEREDPVPRMASEEEAAEALDVFKRDYKARGMKGEEKIAMRELAMRRLSRVQHPLVADRLFKLTKNPNVDIRTLAVMYLGNQRALPGYAGALVVRALKTLSSDSIVAMVGIEAVARLDYRAAVKDMRAFIAHKDEGVKKVALLYIGDTREWRMLEDLLKLMKDLKIDKGWKTEGGEVRYDTGTAGDHDQKMAEKIYKQKYGNSARKARSGGRAMRDMKPILLEAMQKLTGEDFFSGRNAREWADENKAEIEKKQKALGRLAAEQLAAAKAMS